MCGGVYVPQPQSPFICLKLFPKAKNRPFQNLCRKSINSWKHVSCFKEEAQPRPGFPGLRDNLGPSSQG